MNMWRNVAFFLIPYGFWSSCSAAHLFDILELPGLLISMLYPKLLKGFDFFNKL